MPDGSYTNKYTSEEGEVDGYDDGVSRSASSSLGGDFDTYDPGNQDSSRGIGE